MAFDQDIRDYMNASNQAIELAYQGQWEKIADKIRRHYADRGLTGGGDLARVLAEAQQKFTDTINAKKQGMLAEAFRLQASRKQQQDQFRFYEKQQQQAYADQSNYMNRMATGAAMGGYGSQMSSHEQRWRDRPGYGLPGQASNYPDWMLTDSYRGGQGPGQAYSDNYFSNYYTPSTLNYWTNPQGDVRGWDYDSPALAGSVPSVGFRFDT